MHEQRLRPDSSLFWRSDRRAKYVSDAEDAGVKLTTCPDCQGGGKVADRVPGVPASVCRVFRECATCELTGLVPASPASVASTPSTVSAAPSPSTKGRSEGDA